MKKKVYNEQNKRPENNMLFYWTLTKTCLRVLGLWPIFDTETKTGKVINYIHLSIVSFAALQQGINMLLISYITSSNFVSAAESIGPMMALFIAFGKICIYREHRLPLRKLALRIEACLNNENSDEYEYFQNYMKYGNFAFASVCGSIAVLMIGYFSIPLILNNHELPFLAYYPWNYQNSTFFYFVSYAEQVTLTSVLACACATEFTYVWSVCHCCARLKVTQQKLVEISIGKSNRKNYDDDLQKSISSILRLHISVLNDITLINTAYTNIVLLLFLAAIIAICCAGLTITSVTTESMGYELLFMVLAIYYAQQLLFYYYPGDLLAERASAVGTAAYFTGWERFNVKYRKSIRLIMMRSNMPVKLRAGNLSPLTLENYMSFLATTASYFTSIRAVTES